MIGLALSGEILPAAAGAASLGALLSEARALGIEPRHARRFLASVLNVSEIEVLRRTDEEVDVEVCSVARRGWARLCAGEPLSRLVLRRDFYRDSFVLHAGCFDPRPDSETLVEVVQARCEFEPVESSQAGLAPMTSPPVSVEARCANRANKEWRVLDLGCGTGCLGLSLRHLSEHAWISLVDNDVAALSCARANIEALGIEALGSTSLDFKSLGFKSFDLKNRVALFGGSWWEAWHVQWCSSSRLEQFSAPFDIIVSNPPYVRRGELNTLPLAVRAHDPRGALDGGEDGLDALRVILAGAPRHQRWGGLLAVEHGHDQGASVRRLFVQNGYESIITTRDLSGHERVTSGFLGGTP